jgi:hypothetical protein
MYVIIEKLTREMKSQREEEIKLLDWREYIGLKEDIYIFMYFIIAC